MLATAQNLSDVSPERTSSGVSWGAVFAGAAAAAALSLILLVLGLGLGFSTISPWPNDGLGAKTLEASSIAWLVLTQILASGMGGYLAGRLRIKWATVHTDEVYFRDTSHGFLAWAVATMVVAVLITTVLGKAMSATVSTGTTLTATALGAAGASGVASGGHGSPAAATDMAGNSEAMMNYMVDSLFRSAPSAPSTSSVPDPLTGSDNAVRMEAGRIFMNSMHAGSLPLQDQQYLSQVIAKRTGLAPADADKRVSDTFNIVHTAIANAEQSARQAADAARKAIAHSALWMFVSLLCGAFVASLFATFGGRQRDGVTHVVAS